MPRIRTIKPDFWTSEQIVECSTNARLLFVGLWNFCDDQGVHPASTKRLKMEVFPGDNFTDKQIQNMVAELFAADLIVQYKAEGKYWWAVTGWHHQKIDRPNCKYPAPQFDEHSTSIRGTIDEPSPPEKEKEKEKEKDIKRTSRKREAVDLVIECYQKHHPRSKPGDKEKRRINDRLSEGYSASDLCQAIEGNHKSPHHCGQNDSGTKYHSLALIFRDSSHVADFIEKATPQPRIRPTAPQQPPWAAYRDSTIMADRTDSSLRELSDAEWQKRYAMQNSNGAAKG